MSWEIKEFKAPATKKTVLIEGLPGIGNVGKVAIDFLIDELGAKKIYELTSFSLPHSVFINEDNLIEMPKIEIYHKKVGENDFILLAGDVQPSDEYSCYEFCTEIIKLCKKHNCSDIITLGGIGLNDIPKKPKIFCTGNTKQAIKKYKQKNIHTELYGVVGPIVGVSGLLLGMAPTKTNAIALLSETFGHPMYLGVTGAKEILKFLNDRFKFNTKIDKLDKEIKDIEEEVMKRTEDLSNVTKGKGVQTDVNYIG